MTYFSTTKGFVNTIGYFQKNPSFYDVRNHLLVIELLLLSHYKEQIPVNDSRIRDTLCEYIINETYNFREHLLLNLIDKVSSVAGDIFVLNLIKTLLSKVKEVSQRPPVYNREELPLAVSQKISIRVRLALKLSLKHLKIQLSSEDFISLVKLICHPSVAKTNSDLKSLIKELEEVLTK